MVVTFVITRAFVISALFAGAFLIASAAPIGTAQGLLAYNDNQHDKRGCRQMGCLFEVPTDSTTSALPATTAAYAYKDASSAENASVDDSLDNVVTDGSGIEAVFAAATDAYMEEVDAQVQPPSAEELFGAGTQGHSAVAGTAAEEQTFGDSV